MGDLEGRTGTDDELYWRSVGMCGNVGNVVEARYREQGVYPRVNPNYLRKRRRGRLRSSRWGPKDVVTERVPDSYR